jgi:LPS-assembly lipoprotein
MINIKQLHLVLILTLTLSACGFHLRGANEFHYKTAMISGNGQIIPALTKTLTKNGLSIVSNLNQAEIRVELLKEEYEKRILSLSGAGKVTEYELYYRVHYRTKTNGDALWSSPQTLEARRDFSYSDANLLAKQIEERQLNENMQKEVLNSLVRRLSALK